MTENATPNSAWHSRMGAPAPLSSSFSDDFLSRSAEQVARDLLGCRIASSIGDEQTVGVIVEAEAYVGAHDPASHAAERIGRTLRNEAMFGPAGTAYVYLIYGMHWCLNVVTGSAGDPAAVLIRALDPLEGAEAMARRRGRARELCSGPGRLSQALGITGELDGHDLSLPPLRLLPGWKVDASRVGVSGRIGIRFAADWPLRFYIRGHPAVCRPRN